MATNPSSTPQDVQARLATMLAAAAATRSQMLQRFADDSQGEADSLRRVRAELAGTAGENDPRVQALDRRAAGTAQVADFTRRNLVEIAQPTKPGDWVVMGRVLDPEGHPVAGARVTLASENADLVKLFGKTTTDQDGRFTVRHTADELKAILARTPKAQVVVTSQDRKAVAKTHDIQPAGDTIEALDIRLGKPAAASKVAETAKKTAAATPATEEKPPKPAETAQAAAATPATAKKASTPAETAQAAAATPAPPAAEKKAPKPAK
jgi:hypothetical protein